MKKKKEKMSYGAKMRWGAGVCYMLLCVYQMFSLNYVLNNNSIMLTTLPIAWFVEILLMLVAGGLAVWMFLHKEQPQEGVLRGTLVATILVVLFELATYSMQAELVGFSATMLFKNMDDSEVLNYIFVIVRLLLWILGAFFVLSTRDEVNQKPVQKRPVAAKPVPLAEEAKAEELSVEPEEVEEIVEIDVVEEIVEEQEVEETAETEEEQDLEAAAEEEQEEEETEEPAEENEETADESEEAEEEEETGEDTEESEVEAESEEEVEAEADEDEVAEEPEENAEDEKAEEDEE